METLFERHNIKGKGQADVDFLIPFLGLDRRYFLDPSLLRFSKTSLLQEWNQEISDFLDLIRTAIRSGDNSKVMKLLNIGEAAEAGLGYCISGVEGSGVGKTMATSIVAIIRTNPQFIGRGLLRLEELQWLDLNVADDRISDLALNILKRNVIKYTQEQCRLIGIPMKKVRVGKVFYPDSMEWGTLIEEMPIDPTRTVRDAFNPHPPLVLLPKEALKPLPLFLNYNDFYGFIDPDYKQSQPKKPKPEIIDYAISHPEDSDRYIKAREAESERLYRPNFDQEAISLCEQLQNLPRGTKDASEYRKTVRRLLEFVFDDLEFFDEERPTQFGEMKRDIIFRNLGKSRFFAYLIQLYHALHIVVDAKNTDHVTPDDISRVADYLNDNIGRVGFIVSRRTPTKAQQRQAVRQLIDQKKIIIFISDEELKRWVRGKAKIQQITGREIVTVNPIKSLENKHSDLVSS